MGPMAGAAFMARLTALTEARCDQEHIPAILWSDPRVPDRPSGYLGTGVDPLPWMQHGVAQLERMGARAIAIPCNTAHLWYDQLAAATGATVLHIVRAVVKDLKRKGVQGGRIGLLGTAVTLQLELYQRELRAQGYDYVLLEADQHLRYCAESIRLVKFNRLQDACQPAVECIGLLKQQGADAVVLGCTELPLALPHVARAGFDMVISDSIDALAADAIEWYRTQVSRPMHGSSATVR
ncbi:aspartate/glutamate racemase family protein [Parapusillimonas sp. SGNA-6]|nr:aspartate/glutamate racemase family protein [Parapusillimonas sp. SGNA-6]